MNDELRGLKQQLEDERRISVAFTELSKAIMSPVLTRSDIYQMVLDQARELTKSEHGFVSSIDQESGAHVSHTLTKMKAEGCSAPLTEGVLPSGPHKQYTSLWGTGLNTQEAFFTNNPASHPSALGLPEGHVPMKNFLSVPVVFDGLLLGQIALANSTHDYSQVDIDLVKKLAVFYAVVLRNHLWGKALQEANEALERNVEELTQTERNMRRSVEIQTVLRGIAEATVLTPSMDELYKTIYRLIDGILPAKYFHINLLDKEAGEIFVPFNVDDISFIPARRPVGKGMTEYVMRLGRAVYLTPADMDRLVAAGEYAKSPLQKAKMLHYLGAPLIDSKGNAFGVLALVTMDETQIFQPQDVEVLSIIAAQVSLAIERKQAGTALRELNETLEQRVLERTAELEAAIKEIEAFSYSVSHDLKAPLRTLDGFSRLLLEEYGRQLDAQGKNYLERIKDGSMRMGLLIDALLQFSRVGRFDTNLSNVRLSDLAWEVVTSLKQAEPQRNVRLEIQSDLTVIGDQTMLAILLSNLIGNAWKFTGKKADAIVEFGAVMLNGTCTFYVRDNGAGFDMSCAGDIFMPFHRMHLPKDFPGTGIGLALAAKIVRRHGGMIWAESAVDQGATFYFTLGERTTAFN